MSTENGSVEVFLNGEIFNHEKLRIDLEKMGHIFRSNSDAECLPYLWLEHGTDMFQLLNGMFAICIIDHRRREVILARDRMGIKPLYHCVTPNGLVFGSEIKAILSTRLLEGELDSAHVIQFLDTLSVSGRGTLVGGVERLLPGEMLRYAVDSGAVMREHWYDLASSIGNIGSDTAEPSDLLRVLSDSISLRLKADVPVGISLSGGMDSTLIALFASRVGRSQAIAFTVDFPQSPREELDSASAVAAALGMEHIIVRSNTGDFVREAPATIWMSDEPIADPALFPAMKVAAAASQAVTVLLSGAGADELFAGYGHYRLSMKRKILARIPQRIQRLLRPTLEAHGLGEDRMAALSTYARDRFLWHANEMSHFSLVERAALLRQVPQSSHPLEPLREAMDRLPHFTPLSRQLYSDTIRYLPDQLLPLLDRSTMAHSVEGRVPFLDHRVVETAFRLPDGQKLGSRGRTKMLLRGELHGQVPDLVLTRRKLGFPNAVQTWLSGELGDLVPAILADPDGAARRILPQDWLDQFNHRPRMLARWPVVNALIALQIWDRLLIRGGVFDRPELSLRDLFELPHSRSTIP